MPTSPSIWSAAPPCAEILRIADAENILLLVVHHIIVDLWSMDLLLQELVGIYEAELSATPVQLPPLAAQFRDYVRWHLGAIHGPQGQKSWEYWRHQLAGELPVLNLPTDRPRPSVQSYRGSSHSWPLDAGLVQQLRTMASAQNATAFTGLLAVFQILLFRYSGQSEFLVGTVAADRARPEWERTVGYFLNQLVLRVRASGTETFQSFLERMRDLVYEVLEHQDFPFGLLVKRLQPRRDPSRSPLFQVMFIWDKMGRLGNDSLAGKATGKLVLDPFLMEQRGASFDLTFIVFESGDQLTASLRYNTDLFDPATVERMAGHFNQLLAGIVAAPNQPLGELSMLSGAERECLLETRNATARPYAPNVPLARIVEKFAHEAPHAPALFFEETCLTYGELNAQANRLARYLMRRGVGRGQTIALCLPRSPDMIVAVLAGWKIGTPYLFLDPLYPARRIRGMVQDARPALLFAAEPLPDLGVETVQLANEWPTIAAENEQNLDTAIGPDDLAYIIYTSGSTGEPKGTVLRQRGLCNLVAAQQAVFGAKARDRVLQFASLSFDASVFEMALAFGAGASLVLGTQGSLLPGPGLLKLLRDRTVTIATLPPSVPAMLSSAALPALHTLIVAGERCPAEVVAAWGEGRRVFNAYGPTEATVWSTVARCVADGKAPP